MTREELINKWAFYTRDSFGDDLKEYEKMFSMPVHLILSPEAAVEYHIIAEESKKQTVLFDKIANSLETIAGKTI